MTIQKTKNMKTLSPRPLGDFLGSTVATQNSRNVFRNQGHFSNNYAYFSKGPIQTHKLTLQKYVLSKMKVGRKILS